MNYFLSPLVKDYSWKKTAGGSTSWIYPAAVFELTHASLIVDIRNISNMEPKCLEFSIIDVFLMLFSN